MSGRRPLSLLPVILLLAACAPGITGTPAGTSGAGATSGSGTQGGATPGHASPPPESTPRALTEAEAAALVLGSDPRFAGLRPRDPSLVGQGSWYEAARSGGGYVVAVHLGWGDCPSGCIFGHTWSYRVDASGRVTLAGESGDPPEVATPGVTGFVRAGPVCPVERIPPDPACAPRPVVGAVLVVQRPDRTEIARTTSRTGGGYHVDLPPGDYVLVAQPVAGLMGAPAPISFHVVAGSGAAVRIDLEYDTGIR